MDTHHQRGIYLRAQCKYMGLDFDQWPQEAQDVEIAEYRAWMEREARQAAVGFAPPTRWERFKELFGF